METLDITREGQRRSRLYESGAFRTAPHAVVESGTEPVGLRIAYLLSQYPAVSHTFFLHEIFGLRSRGLHIETASINRPDRPAPLLPPAEALESTRTFYVKDGSFLRSLVTLLGTVILHPLVALRGLLAVVRIPGLSLRKRAFWLFYLAEAILVGRWMRRRRLQHLHVHFGGPVASVGMLVSRAWNIPYSLTIHGPEELLNTESYHLREKLGHASFVFCISDFCRSQLCQITPPAEWNKFQVIRLGVDPVMLTPRLRSATSGVQGPQTRPMELVTIGRLVPAKGHRVLLEALRMLRDNGLAIHLTLIGSGPDRADLEQFVAANGMQDAVTFTSALSHDRALAQLQRADLFALASFAEGIPVALMEAMALGLACVSTSIAGIPELIRTGVDGILVPPANATALASALESLVTDAALRKTMGHSARQRIIKQYNLPLNHELLAQSFAEHIAPLQPAGPETAR